MSTINDVYFIYTISDPRDNSIFYIGQTINFTNRRQRHLDTSDREFKKNSSKTQIVKDLKKLKLNPVFDIIHTNIPFDKIDELETGMISFYHLMGCYLTNREPGGNSKSLKTREKISNAQLGSKNHNFGKKASQKTRELISKANSGEGNANFGKSKTDEQKLKISKANSGAGNGNYGKKFSNETKSLISKSLKKYTQFTEEYFIENYIIQNKSQNQIAKENKCSVSAVAVSLKKLNIYKKDTK